MDLDTIYRSHISEMKGADYQALLIVIAWMDETYDIVFHNGIDLRARHGTYLRESYALGRSPRFTASCIVHGLVN